MRASHVCLALGIACLLAALACYASWGGGSDRVPRVLDSPQREPQSMNVAAQSLPAAPDVPEPVPARAAAPQPELRVPVELPPIVAPQLHATNIPPPPEPAPPLEIAGDISGRLVSEKGFWLESELPEADTLIVELVRLQEPHLEQRAELVIAETEQGKSLHFEFSDVPVGDYELSLFSLGSFHWEPRTLRVRAPAAGLDFVRFDQELTLPILFEVYDAASGERIADFKSAHLEQTVSDTSGVFMHAGPLAGQAFPRAASFRWSVWDDGYRASFGDESAFEERDGQRVARVDLRTGWSARIVVLGREPTLRPLYRARVEIDGAFAGVTGQDGALVVERDVVPESILVLYKNWELENDPLDPRPGTTPELRGHVLPLILRAPE